MFDLGLGSSLNIIIHIGFWVLSILGLEGIIGYSAFKIGQKVARTEMREKINRRNIRQVPKFER
ncbi:MAG: hypothetical protein QGE99_00500 [SAR202 cluster bacterium]|jgi:hypothetical protein|nr:hypothetical protein [SAR202 cluster bacterium]|tara:strand:- start:732 stop:923 length:192 start_codon:yes stop_codon:yes gene_type:complete